MTAGVGVGTVAESLQRATTLPVAGRRLRFEPELELAFRGHFFRNSRLMMRVALVLAVVLYAAFGVLDLWIVPTEVHQLWTIRFAIVCPALTLVFALTFHRGFERWMQPLLAAAVLVAGAGILAMLAIASATDGAPYYAGLILVIVWSYTLVRLTFVLATAVAWLLVIAYNVVAVGIRPEPIPILLNNNFFFVSANVIGMLGCYYLERYIRNDFLHRLAIEEEQARAERLLLNILPPAIANRLKLDHRAIADGFDSVTVLFADIVGFTSLSARLAPLDLVHLLNEIFTAVDGLVEKHGLEKIKTIGDAYMVVGGLPTRRSDHAQAVADFALDMQREITRFRAIDGTQISTRIGINSGAVVAGVIGTKKFIYDLWGDAVNTASRMESHGVPGDIQVSESTYELLRDHYEFEYRGPIDVKGKGALRTWLLRGRRATAAAIA